VRGATEVLGSSRGPRRRSPLFAALLIACGTAIASPAYADNAAQAAAARTLFDEARQLAASGKYKEACPKFEESQRLDPGMGTLFNLADCYEHTGRTASAWVRFLEVASEAKAKGRTDQEKAARARAAAVAPKLSRVSVGVPPPAMIDGLEVRLDGAAMGREAWGTQVPVDPGSHTVEARAPGRKTWTTSIEVASEGGTALATIPVLEVESATQPGGAQSSTPEQQQSVETKTGAAKGKTQRMIGLVTGGVGIVGLGASVIVGLGAKSKLSDADAYCSADACWDQRGIQLHDDARSQATLATIVGGVGAAALVTGAVLYFTAPSDKAKTTAATTSPMLMIGPAGVSMKGVW